MAGHYQRGKHNYREDPFAELKNQLRATTKQIIWKYHYKSDNRQEREALASLLANASPALRGRYMIFASDRYNGVPNEEIKDQTHQTHQG